MRKRNYQHAIACVSLALLMVFEGAFSLTAFAGEEIADGQADSEQTSEENLADVEDLLIYEGEAVSEDSLQDDESIDYEGFIFKLKEDTTAGERRELESSIDELPADETVEELNEDTFSADSMETISDVVPADEIEYIEPDVKCELMGSFTSTPNDSYFNNSKYNWPWIKTDTAGAWAQGAYGQNFHGSDKITVAVIDSGVASRHPDLNYSNISAGVSYFEGTTESDTEDYVGHGTFVTGIINATMNNKIGVSGSMPALEIYPIRIFKKGENGATVGGNISDLIKGINTAVSIDADVINMSLGTKSRLQSLDDACSAAVAKGIILVASAGNDGSNVVNYPAGCPGVIGVGSVTEFVVRASSSNYNSSVDVSAPGHGVIGLSIADNADYEKGYGTSFSAPMVAALAGMAKSIDRSTTASDFEAMLAQTCRDCGAKGKDNEYGYGVINYSAMAKLMLAEDNNGDSDPEPSNPGNPGTVCTSHKWSSVAEKQASFSNDGILKKTCTICGAQKTETIPKLSTAKLSATSFSYSGANKNPSVSVTDVKGNTLVENTDYTVTKPAEIKKVGSYSYKLVFKGKYSGSKTLSFKINPAIPGRKSISAGTKKLTVRMTSLPSAKGASYFQIAYKRKGTSSWKYTTTSSGSKTIKSLSKGKYYYVKIRAYKTVNSTKYYSSWTKTYTSSKIK